MINVVWSFLILSGIGYYFFTGNWQGLNNQILTSASQALELVWSLMPIIVLWTGILKIAEASHMLEKFAQLLEPLLRKIFPSIRHNKLALGYIASNIAANAMGLGSAATPAGLKAMQELQKVNPQKDEASEAMVTFLVLNTAGVTVIPTTIIAMRVMYNSQNPSEIILPAVLATAMSSLGGLTLDYIIRRWRRK